MLSHLSPFSAALSQVKFFPFAIAPKNPASRIHHNLETEARLRKALTAAAVELGTDIIYAPAEMLHLNHQAVDTEIVVARPAKLSSLPIASH